MQNDEPVRGRRQAITLTEEQIDMIADKAAEKAVEKLTAQAYQAVGKGVVSRFIWIVGVCSVGLFIWLQHKGFIK